MADDYKHSKGLEIAGTMKTLTQQFLLLVDQGQVYEIEVNREETTGQKYFIHKNRRYHLADCMVILPD